MADSPTDQAFKSCNRVPFLSGEGCDRGDIDIHQFDDLPFCENISPTTPKIPPEVIDSQIVIPVPPPCACININHKFKLNYNSTGKFSANTAFKSRGDCCAGNYEANFDLKIPCPINGKGSIGAGISWGNGDSFKKVDIAHKTDPCGLEFKNPEIRLQIPCPIIGNGQITAGVSWGAGAPVTKTIAKKSGTCSLQFDNPVFDLKIPCPIEDNGEKKIKVNVEYGDTPNPNVEETFARVSHDNCSIELLQPEFNLNIKCPLQNGDKELKLKPVQYVSNPVDKNIRYVHGDRTQCNLEVLEPELQIQAPCPLTGLSFTKGQMTTSNNDTPSITFTPVENGCNREFKVDLDVPKSQGYDKNVLSDIQFRLSGSCIQYRRVFFNLRDKTTTEDDWSDFVCFSSGSCSNVEFTGSGTNMYVRVKYA